MWKANPTVSITKQPTALTVVAGNTGSFSLTATGNGSLTYQWYYNTSNSTSGGTAISGATSSTYSFTSSTAMSGRYYYCVVTSTVGSSTATATSTPVLLKVQAANYSILNAGKTVYYNTISTAITDAVSGGGDTGGGTIKVLNTVTDNTTANTDKTITIDTNGKTLTRNQSIITTAGTLTIKGNGTIYCNADQELLILQGGNLIVSDTPTIKSLSNAVWSMANTSGNITINGGYFYSTDRTSIVVYGNGDVSISSAYVYTPVKDRNALLMDTGTTGKVTITDSTIGNASSNTSGLDGSGGILAAISYSSTGNLTLDNSRILSGPYGASSIAVYNAANVNIIGSTTLCACNVNESGVPCISIDAYGATINFNSTGYFYCTGSYVAYSKVYSATYNVTKGHFVSRNNKYMFYKSGAAVTSYASSTSAGNRNFYYMNAYNSKTLVTIPNCYYYTKGV